MLWRSSRGHQRHTAVVTARVVCLSACCSAIRVFRAVIFRFSCLSLPSNVHTWHFDSVGITQRSISRRDFFHVIRPFSAYIPPRCAINVSNIFMSVPFWNQRRYIRERFSRRKYGYLTAPHSSQRESRIVIDLIVCRKMVMRLFSRRIVYFFLLSILNIF